MKHQLAQTCCCLLLISLGGCQTKPLAPAPLETVREDIARLQSNLDSRADAEQEVLVSTMTLNLAKVGNALDELSSRVSETCQVAIPNACDPLPEAVLADTDKLVVGQVEKVWVDAPGFFITARVDTGAHSS